MMDRIRAAVESHWTDSGRPATAGEIGLMMRDDGVRSALNRCNWSVPGTACVHSSSTQHIALIPAYAGLPRGWSWA